MADGFDSFFIEAEPEGLADFDVAGAAGAARTNATNTAGAFGGRTGDAAGESDDGGLGGLGDGAGDGGFDRERVSGW